jgi:2-amino-4-hydroxy-6-hydroxymethyldihydropteridine diphosphokinase/dihydropteroate synthase
MSTITPLAAGLRPIKALARDRATHLMAILNVTPDSFSDGGLHFRGSAQEIKATVAEYLHAGASIIDIGGQSTRPGAEDVGLDEELNRVITPIRTLRDAFSPEELCISIDTYRARVAREAIAAGADMVNDISGGMMDPAMFPTVAELGCTLVIMHTRGTPATMSALSDYPSGVTSTVAEELRGRVEAAGAAGIRRWRIIVDPGIGFAKAQAHNLELLRHLPEVRQAPGLRGLPMLVGPSRKGFIGRITGVKEAQQRIWGTAAAVSAAVAGGADIVRVHDVAEMNKVVKMADAIWRS